MLPFSQSLITFSFLLSSTLLLASPSPQAAAKSSSSSSIYEALRLHGLPMGLLPKGVENFTLDNSGKFQVHLGQACNAKFENEIHYDADVSGNLSYGQIDELSGISAKDLFLWFPVKVIRVDIPSSGLIYFDVGVVSKQFSLSSFETPRDCVAVQFPGVALREGNHLLETLPKSRSREPGMRKVW